MTRLFPLLSAGAAMFTCAALLACSAPGPVSKDARKTVAVQTTNAPAPSANASGAPPANQASAEPMPEGATSEAAAALPPSLVGRWGLTPGDCTSRRGDAKGLLVISPGELRFYESRALPTSDVQSDATSANGTFRFTGEGQSWAKYEGLKLDKTMLVRTESNPTASFTYAKCT